MDEFIKIFNSCLGNDDSLENPCWQKSLTRLFDLESETLFLDSNLISHFISSYSDNTFKKLSFFDLGWYALVTCRVKYKGDIREIKLTLSPEKNNYGGYMWAILGIDTNFLQKPMPNDTIYGLSPVSETINFKDINKLFKNDSPVTYYVPPNKKLDNISVLLYCIQNNEIEFKEVVNVEHYFTQQQNWILVIKNFDRLSSNAGWLISNIYQVTEIEKQNFIRNILSIGD
jgi:hypothetical protein